MSAVGEVFPFLVNEKSTILYTDDARASMAVILTAIALLMAKAKPMR